MDDDTLAKGLASDLDGHFEALVQAHQDRVYGAALRMTLSRQDAEEVAQDTFVRAYKALRGYSTERTASLLLRPWLARICLNLCRNRARTAGRRPVTVPLVSDVPEATVGESSTTDEWSERLSLLPPLYRPAVVLRHVVGLSYPELAEALRVPQGTAKARVHRGVAQLRTMLEHEKEEEHD